jgi:RNA polymerase sigma factor (sigma-70 family)
MPPDEFESVWIRRLKSGDSAAAQKLWERYYGQLVRVAQKKLTTAPRRVADEEDVALSAMNSFCMGAREGKFPQLNDHDDLWRLLVTITARKAMHQVRRNRRQKRGGGGVRGESIFLSAGDSDAHGGLDQFLGQEPSPGSAAEMAEDLRLLLARLEEQPLRDVALLKLQGYANEEIAQRLDCGLRTVERRLRLIRALWCEDEAK